MFLLPVNGPLEAMPPKEKLVNKRDFDRSINNQRKSAKNDSSFFITKSKYNLLVGQVKSAKKKKSSELPPRLAQLVKKYDVVTSEGVERLAVPNSKKQLIYVAKDELFSVIQKAHIDTDHGKLTEMSRKLKTKYKNVSNEAVKSYIRLCQGCKTRTSCKRERGSMKEDELKENVETRSKRQTNDKQKEPAGDLGEKPKRKYTKKSASEKSKVPAKTPQNPKSVRRFKNTPENASTSPLTAGSRTPQRIDFIEMTHCNDDEYNYIVVVRESSTKFVHLRPLKCHDPRELADILLPIFLCFGTPSVLSTSNPEFILSSLQSLYANRPDVADDIVVEPSEGAEFFTDIETLMLSWVRANSDERWVKGLRFIQYIANLSYNKDIDKTPFEAMFGRKGKLDVSTLNLPAELLNGIRPEGDEEEIRDVGINEMPEEDEEEIRDIEINEMLEVVKPKRKYTKKSASEKSKVPAKTPQNPKSVRRFKNTPENASTRPLTAGSRTPHRIDFIEMTHCNDDEYNYIVVVRESCTKFVHLRPLKCHDPRELADILLPIFLCFGTPSVLSTSNPEFILPSLQSLYSKRPDVADDIVVEPSEGAEFFADIETLMLSWVCANSVERWVKGLRFIQYIANLTYNKDIDKTPFEAMFGRKGKLDVSTLNLPAELLKGIRPEEDEEIRDVGINEMPEEDEEEIRDVEINEMLEVVMDDED